MSASEPSKSVGATGRISDAIALIAVIGVVAVCALRPIWNSDIWWHIVVGDWILETLRLPHDDVWSAHEGGVWTSFSWLYQALVAGAHRVVGLEGVRLLSALWVTASFALFYVLLRRGGASVGHAALLTAALLIAYHYRIRVRPHVVNLTALTTIVFYLRWAAPRWWHAALAAAGFAVWSALHAGGALIGIGAVVVALAAAALLARGDASRDARLRFYAVGLGALVGWIVVPGSLRTVMVVAGNQGETIGAVAEWVSYPAMWERLGAAQTSVYRVQLIACLALWPLAVVYTARRMRDFFRFETPETESPAPRRLIGFAVAAYLFGVACLWFRFYYVGILALALLPFAQSAVPERTLSPKRLVAAFLAALSFVFSTSGQFGTIADGMASRTETYDARYYPVAEAELLGASGLEARVATIAAWGGFVLYEGRPRLRVTMDGRNAAPPEVTLLHEAIEATIRTCQGMEELPAMYAALPADILLMPAPNSACPGMPPNPIWMRVSSSPQAEIYLRHGPETGAWIQALQETMATRRP